MEALDLIFRSNGGSRKLGENKFPVIADDTEDAIIAALDAGMTSDEIADIMLGSVS